MNKVTSYMKRNIYQIVWLTCAVLILGIASYTVVSILDYMSVKSAIEKADKARAQEELDKVEIKIKLLKQAIEADKQHNDIGEQPQSVRPSK